MTEETEPIFEDESKSRYFINPKTHVRFVKVGIGDGADSIFGSDDPTSHELAVDQDQPLVARFINATGAQWIENPYTAEQFTQDMLKKSYNVWNYLIEL